MLPHPIRKVDKCPKQISVLSLSTRRGEVLCKATRLNTRLQELEGKADAPTCVDPAQRMMQKLEALDPDFKIHHFALIDLVDEPYTLQEEQATLEEHDDNVAQLTARIQQSITIILCPAHSASSDSNTCKVSFRRLLHLRKNLSCQ